MLTKVVKRDKAQEGGRDGRDPLIHSQWACGRKSLLVEEVEARFDVVKPVLGPA